MELKSLLKFIVAFVLCSAKSFFYAVTQVAWGLVSIVGFNLAILFLIEKNNQVMPEFVSGAFLQLTQLIVNYIMLWVGVFFLYAIIFCYSEWRSLLRRGLLN